MKNKVDILGVKINKIGMAETCQYIFSVINNKEKAMVVTPNAEMIMRARDNDELRDILNNAELSLPDGAGVLLAAKLFKLNIKERVSGFDLLTELLSDSVDNNYLDNEKYSVYFLGGKPGIAKKMVKKLKENPDTTLANNNKLSSKLNISGFHHGYLDEELSDKVLKEINEKKPDILFVGMGVPLQEKFLKENMDKLDIKVGITVGGSFDVLAGELNRAPKWMQNAGLEWFYRLLQEPTRFKRMLALPKFAFLAFYKSIFWYAHKKENKCKGSLFYLL